MATLSTGTIRVRKPNSSTWVDLPVPYHDGLSYEIETLVEDARDATGTFTGATVGYDKIKLNITYPPLDDDECRKVMSFFDRERGGVFKFYCNFYDPRVGARVTRFMYVGNRSFKPWIIEETTVGRPKKWIDVQANFIEV